jgi:Fe-S-cluster containining protein
MLELIKAFTDARLPQAGSVAGRYYTRTGSCQSCGKCCKDIYLAHGGKALTRIEDFTRLKAKNPEYRSFVPVDNDEEGLLFRCINLTEDNRCADYDNRPYFCRSYPSEKGILMGGKLAEGCGYAFEPIATFQQVLSQSASKQKFDSGRRGA